MAKGVNIPLTISGLREAREDLAKLNDEFEKVKDDPIKSKKLAKEFNDLSKAVDDTTESLKEMNAAGELAGTKFDDLNEVLFQTNEEVLPLTSQIGEMEDRMYQLAQANQQGSKEFQELQKKVVAARKTIIETDRSIDLMTENTGSLGGLTSAFGELGDSVLSLDFKRMGQSVKGLGVQFKAFGRVLLANPLFLIVAIVAAIVGAIIAFKDKVKFLSDIFEALGAVIDIVIQAFKDLLDFLGLTNFAEQDLAEERKKRAEENIANIERQSKAEQAAFDRKIALASAEGKSTTELEIAKQKAIIETNRQRAEELKIIAEQERILGNLTKDRVNEIIGQANEITENVKNAKNQIKIIEVNAAKEARARAKERSDLKDKELAEDKKRADELNAYLRQAELERLAQEEELAEIIYQAGLTQQEREITAVNDKYFNLIESAKQFGLDTQALEIEQQEALAKINKTYADAEEARKKAAKDKADAARKKEIEDEQKLQEAKLSLVSSGLNVVGQLTDAFGKKNEAAAKRAFQIQKAISIAQAVIDTYKGANAIFASAAANPQSVLFPAQPFITAGLAIAAGIANVAKIAQTQFGGGSTPSASSPSAPSLGGGGGTSASASTPSFELFGQPNEDNNVSAAQAQELTPTVVKAVVVESDITTTQNKISKMKENAEL
jgi:hypothetical protein